MTRIKEFAIAFFIVFALFALVGVLLPSKRSYTFSVETNRPMRTVYDFLNGFQRAKDWFPLRSLDAGMKIDVSGEERGVGAQLDYSSTKKGIGSGTWKITKSEQDELIVFTVNNEDMGNLKTARFKFERTGRGMRNVQITSIYTVDYGFNLIGRYAGLYMARQVGSATKKSMRNLADKLAAVPRFEYHTYKFPIAVSELPAVNILRAPATSRRANADVALALTNQMKWIERVIEDNGLEKAGPMQIVTIDFGTETYTFDVVQPVRKKGARDGASESADEAAAEGAEAGAESDEANAEAEVELMAAELPTLKIKIEGDGNPVTYEQLPVRKVVHTDFVGPAPGLNRIRGVLKAWALVRGMEPDGNPFEDFRVEIPQMLADDAEYHVYIPLKTEQ